MSGFEAPLISLALSLGSQLVMSFFQKPPKQAEVNLQMPKSDYGVGIPKIYGKVRLEGNKFFPQTKNLMYKVENVQTSSGGKGGGRSQQTNEKKIYGSVAVLFCEGKVRIEGLVIQGEYIMTDHPFFTTYCTWFDGTQESVWSVVSQDEHPYNLIKYKGVAYIGIHEAPLDRYGNQIFSQVAAVLIDDNFGEAPRLDLVVGDILTRAGLDSSLWDVSDLNEITLRDGLVVQQSGESYRQVIEGLMEFYLFAPFQDATGKLIFKRLRRGGSSVISLNNRYFVPNDNDNSYIQEIKSDFELPTKLSIKYYNNSRNYEQDEVSVYLGNKTESDNNVKNVSETLYSFGYEIEERARLILSYLYSQEKNRYLFKLPVYYYSQFKCLDVVTLPNGQTVQITKISIGADYVLDIEANYYDAVDASYVAIPDTAITPPVLSNPSIPLIFIIDAPVLPNDLPGSLYCFATNAPTVIQYSDDGVNWNNATTHLYGSIIGDCLTVIDSTLDVNLIWGQGLESITDDEFNVDLGNNLGFVGRDLGSGVYEGEFFQFRDVQILGTNQYRLSTLKRGLNNTGNFSHSSGEKFFLFKGVGAYYSIIVGNANFIGSSVSFRPVVSDWQNLATTPTVTVTPVGNAYKPPAPSNLTGIIDAEGNIQLFWEYSNSFSPYQTSQESVSYEVEINGIRTLTSNTKDVLYLVGDRTTDGLTPPLNVKIWAISSVVGRGYEYADTVNTTLVPNSILGTGNGLAGITIYDGDVSPSYTVQESDNNKIILCYTVLGGEFYIDFPDTLSNGFNCYVVNAWGNQYVSYFRVRGTNFFTRLENNRIKVGDSRQVFHVSSGNYFVLGKNKILYDYFTLDSSGTLPINAFMTITTAGISLTFPNDAIEGDFIGLRTAPGLGLANNPVTLIGGSFSVEGGGSFVLNTDDERLLFYFAGTEWIYLTRHDSSSGGISIEDVDDRVAQLLVEGDNIDLVYDDNANSLTIGVSGLATVATSGSYNDLSDKPIPNLTVKDSEGSFTQVGILDFGSQFDVTFSGESQEVNVLLRNETIDDRVANLLIAGNNISLTYNDNLNILTIDADVSSLTHEIITTNTTLTVNSVNSFKPIESITCQLPSNPSQGDRVFILDGNGSDYSNPTGFGLSSCVVLGNGKTIQGLSGITLATENASLELIYNGSRWDIIGWNRNFSLAHFYDFIDDRVANLLVGGTNVTLNYDDTANTLTINSTASGGGGSVSKTDIWMYGGGF